jgi:hypothetical protein
MPACRVFTAVDLGMDLGMGFFGGVFGCLLFFVGVFG